MKFGNCENDIMWKSLIEASWARRFVGGFTGRLAGGLTGGFAGLNASGFAGGIADVFGSFGGELEFDLRFFRFFC